MCITAFSIRVVKESETAQLFILGANEMVDRVPACDAWGVDDGAQSVGLFLRVFTFHTTYVYHVPGILYDPENTLINFHAPDHPALNLT